MNTVPIERVAARLPEAPHYITDMEFPVIVENVYLALREFKMLPLKNVFKVFDVKDYKLELGVRHAIHNVVVINTTVSNYNEDMGKVNQIIFKEQPNEPDGRILDTTSLDNIKRYVPHIIGPYIDYTEDGACLNFKETDICVGVEYTTLAVDPATGYPLIPEQAELAVVAYVAYIHYYGEFMAGRLDGARLQYAEVKLEEARRAARNDHRLSQNQLDKLLNTMTSFDRKTYGWSA